jgi:hypothetical protein
MAIPLGRPHQEGRYLEFGPVAALYGGGQAAPETRGFSGRQIVKQRKKKLGQSWMGRN